MKKIILVLALAALAAPVHAQRAAPTNAEILKAANASVCETYSLADDCSDAQVLAAWCVKNSQDPCTGAGRPVDQIIYSTFAVYANTVLVPKAGDERFAQRLQSLTERLIRMIQTNKAKCVAVFTAAELSTDACQ